MRVTGWVRGLGRARLEQFVDRRWQTVRELHREPSGRFSVSLPASARRSCGSPITSCRRPGRATGRAAACCCRADGTKLEVFVAPRLPLQVQRFSSRRWQPSHARPAPSTARSARVTIASRSRAGLVRLVGDEADRVAHVSNSALSSSSSSPASVFRGRRAGPPGPPRSFGASRSAARSPRPTAGRGRAPSRRGPRPGPAESSSATTRVDRRVEIGRRPRGRARSGARRRRVNRSPRDEPAARGARPDLRERERRDHRRHDPELHLAEREHAPTGRRRRCRSTRRARTRRRARVPARARRPARGSRRSRRASRAGAARRRRSPRTVSSTDERIHSTSAPAENDGPSPDSRTARASPTSANASASSPISAASNALRRSGRAIAMRSTGPSRSIAQRAHPSNASPSRRELRRDRHRRLEVEHLDDLRVLADQLARPRRQLLLGGLPRLPDVDRAPALGRPRRRPTLEEEPRDLLELLDRLVAEVAPQLADVRQRVREVPEHEPRRSSEGPRAART